jgi:hypothetical protein
MSILITPLNISRLSITINGESLRKIRYLLIISIDCYVISSLGSWLQPCQPQKHPQQEPVASVELEPPEKGRVADRGLRYREHHKIKDLAYGLT